MHHSSKYQCAQSHISQHILSFQLHLSQGQELQALRQSATFATVVYAGDGANDLCPALALSPEDHVVARSGYALQKLIERRAGGKEGPRIEAQVRVFLAFRSVLPGQACRARRCVGDGMARSVLLHPASCTDFPMCRAALSAGSMRCRECVSEDYCGLFFSLKLPVSTMLPLLMIWCGAIDTGAHLAGPRRAVPHRGGPAGLIFQGTPGNCSTHSVAMWQQDSTLMRRRTTIDQGLAVT